MTSEFLDLGNSSTGSPPPFSLPPSSSSCEDFFDLTRDLTDLSGGGGGSQRPGLLNMTEGERRHLAVRSVIDGVAIPVVCLFGIVGNGLNLIVLTRKRVQHSMDHLEKSVHVGFVALAVSDMCFCFIDFTSRFLGDKYTYFGPRDWVFSLYFKTYKESFLNVFMLASTWLTVVMALGRYLAVCRPLHARGLISLNGTRVAIGLVFFGSVCVNGPRFLHYEVFRTPCLDLLAANNVSSSLMLGAEGCPCFFYHQDTGGLYRYPAFVFSYHLVWSILAILLPLFVLSYCNACLVRALRQSYRVQKLYRANEPKDSGHRITPTLVALILMFIVLVGPSGVLSFLRIYVLEPEAPGSLYYLYMTATDVTNLLVLVNFAVNFVLYCVVNVHFRRTAEDVLCFVCRFRRRSRSTFSSVIYLTRYTARNTVIYNVSDADPTEL